GRHRPGRRGGARQRGAHPPAGGARLHPGDRTGRGGRAGRDLQHQRRSRGRRGRRRTRRREAHPPDRRAGHQGHGWSPHQHTVPEGSRAVDAGRRHRRRHAAQGRVLSPRTGGGHRQGPHHRRASPARDSARAVHARRCWHRTRSLEVTMDTKQLMEWSAKYHTPNYGRTPLVLVRGEGVRVWDSDGREYLDFTTGIAVTGLGHCHPVVTGAIREAAATLLHVSNIFHNAPQVHLAKLLVEHSFADRVFFCNSGAEANEAALKVVRKYGKERLASDRYEVIATNNSFHGRTLATVTATGQPKYQHGFEPLMPGFKHVPYNDLRAMERAMDSPTAAVLGEPIQGEGGVCVPDDDYLPGLRKLCDESGALLVFDEVQTGVGGAGGVRGAH